MLGNAGTSTQKPTRQGTSVLPIVAVAAGTVTAGRPTWHLSLVVGLLLIADRRMQEAVN